MRTILFTGFDKAYEPLAELTVPLMELYAAKHGIGFIAYTGEPEGFNIYWTGVVRGLALLQTGYDRVMYVDADQMITNLEKPPECSPSYGFYASQDWGKDAVEPWHFSACGWIAHRDCIPMFQEVLKMELEWRDKPFQEQGPWREWMRIKTEHMQKQLRDIEPPDPPAFINISRRRTFNAVPDQVCPGEIPEPWQIGDFAAHLTMAPLERRIEIFKEIRKQLC